MYLALNEMKRYKVRYGLVIAVISLITFLIFILSSLALGLSNENTAALNSWKIKSAVITKDANGNVGQSLMTQKQVDSLPSNDGDSLVGITPTNLKTANENDAITIQYIGLNADEAIFKSLVYSEGHAPKADNEVVISDSVAGVKLNDQVQMGQSDKNYTVVGFVKNGKYNMAPVVYGNINQWHQIKGIDTRFVGSGILSTAEIKSNSVDKKSLKVLPIEELKDKLPGHSAQNATFSFMIGFLVLISLVVVTIFLYILTTQKISNLAVLRAQGVPTRYLIKNTFNETAIIMIASILIGLVGTLIVSLIIPEKVPMYFDFGFILLTAMGTLATGLLGGLIPMRIISKIDPVSVIGG